MTTDPKGEPRISEERLKELVRYNKQQAIYFEQISDNGRFIDNLNESKLHWDMVDALRELLELRREWQPIQTAPKHTRVLMFFSDVDILMMDASSWKRDESDDYWPTHWMPLPVAPKVGEG